MAEQEAKPKRGSIIRRKRGSSMKVKPTTSGALTQSHRAESEPLASDVSILVTEASPETPALSSGRPALTRQQSEATVVQVLVHRESEEYNQEEEDELTPTIQITGESIADLSEVVEMVMNPNALRSQLDS